MRDAEGRLEALASFCLTDEGNSRSDASPQPQYLSFVPILYSFLPCTIPGGRKCTTSLYKRKLSTGLLTQAAAVAVASVRQRVIMCWPAFDACAAANATCLHRHALLSPGLVPPLWERRLMGAEVKPC